MRTRTLNWLCGCHVVALKELFVGDTVEIPEECPEHRAPLADVKLTVTKLRRNGRLQNVDKPSYHLRDGDKVDVISDGPPEQTLLEFRIGDE